MKNKSKQRKSSILGGCIIVDDWLMAVDWRKVHGVNKKDSV